MEEIKRMQIPPIVKMGTKKSRIFKKSIKYNPIPKKKAMIPIRASIEGKEFIDHPAFVKVMGADEPLSPLLPS
ncbi:hypothetical protein LCL89_15800 [Halobacillus yeomjeoni]|uniref:hypothetical protein n=1 Tax=Halobacillus yeomjeoni TaxID=311194 RepID=UPI001CD54792|nr:hypothetical protein [Halobacillus yeomjeoni]MCA0985500.1 hypothetical protein [Halobacillus yeomjeoni]